MNSIRNAGNYLSSKTKGSAREASKEANKQYVGPSSHARSQINTDMPILEWLRTPMFEPLHVYTLPVML